MIRRIPFLCALLFFFAASPRLSAAVTVTTASLPTAKVSVGYRTTLMTVGGTSPYRWRILSGALPPGLVFAESVGVIVGVPEQPVNASLTFLVTDASGATASTTLTLDVLGEIGERHTTWTTLQGMTATPARQNQPHGKLRRA